MPGLFSSSSSVLLTLQLALAMEQKMAAEAMLMEYGKGSLLDAAAKAQQGQRQIERQ